MKMNPDATAMAEELLSLRGLIANVLRICEPLMGTDDFAMEEWREATAIIAQCRLSITEDDHA